jgi:hypothetical protein
MKSYLFGTLLFGTAVGLLGSNGGCLGSSLLGHFDLF